MTKVAGDFVSNPHAKSANSVLCKQETVQRAGRSRKEGGRLTSGKKNPLLYSSSNSFKKLQNSDSQHKPPDEISLLVSISSSSKAPGR